MRGGRPCRFAAGAERLAPIQPGEVQRLKFLGQARQFGVPLPNYRDPLMLKDAQRSSAEMHEIAARPLARVDGRLAGLPPRALVPGTARAGTGRGPQPPLRPAWTARRRAGQFDLMNARMAAMSPSVRVSPKAGIPEVMGTPMSSRTAGTVAKTGRGGGSLIAGFRQRPW